MSKIIRAWLFAMFTLLSGSALAAPCAGFIDVDDTDVGATFCSAVEWIRNRTVTIGCTSPVTYCPNNGVSRLQMAAFMQRLGTALTPTVLFVDQNPGPVTIQGGAYGYVCQSPPYVIPIHNPPQYISYPRRAIAHGLVWGLVNAPVTWSADLWYSTDNGASFSSMSNYIPLNAATTAGGTSGTTFAQVDLNVGTTYIFAILVRESPDATAGTGNFLDVACHLKVEIGNRNSPTSPLDPELLQPAGGSLGGNRAP